MRDVREDTPARDSLLLGTCSPLVGAGSALTTAGGPGVPPRLLFLRMKRASSWAQSSSHDPV